MLLKNCRFLVTQDSERRILEHVDVLIEGDRIARIGKGLAHDGETVDCARRIVLPGLINAHAHLGMTGLRGISDDKELKEWLADMHAAESEMRDGDIREGAALGIKEALRTGTTTIVDMFFRMELAAAEAQSLGVRFVGGISMLSGHPLSAKDTALPHDVSARVGYAYGPHAIYSVPEEALRDIAAASRESGKRVMIHLSETRAERAAFKASTGVLPVEYLARIGFLGEHVLLVHCVWLTKGELDLINAHDAKVVHCPQSNMKLAGGGVMPFREMRERGITVALGTDGVASNNAMDMFREMHTAALLHKQHYWDATAACAQDVLDMATIEGARAIHRDDLGSIQEGKRADIITLDLDDPNLQPCTRDRVVSHLVYAANGMNVADVIVDGRIVVREKRFA